MTNSLMTNTLMMSTLMNEHTNDQHANDQYTGAGDIRGSEDGVAACFSYSHSKVKLSDLQTL
jgi:hypothetical protein